MTKILCHIYIAGLCILTLGCQSKTNSSKMGAGSILAEVYGKKLYQSELIDEGIIQSGQTPKDSLFATNNYVQQWIKYQIMLSEAEKTMAEDLDIERLVQDYKESLLLYNYEKAIIDSQLDTIVTPHQIEEYFEINQKNFTLQESILRCKFAKISSKTSGIERFYKNWKADKDVSSYMEQYAEIYMSDEERWYTVDEILSLLPEKITIRSLSTKKQVQTAHEGYEYFVKIMEYVDKSEDPPLSYVSSNIKKILLHDRKNKLLQKLKEDLYKKEINSSRVRVYN